MGSIPYSHLDKGTFLIATPDVESGVFARSVLLLCEHSASGSFGIIINKPLELELPEEILAIDDVHNPHVQIRAGGPVQTNQMMLIHSSNAIANQTIEIIEGVYLGGDLQFLQESVTRNDGPSMLLCFGYTGWHAGQLEREFLDGGWFLSPASKEHIFETPVDKLWQRLLLDLGGKYASLSMIPEDLSLN